MWQTSGRCSRSSVQDVRYMHPSLRSSKRFPVRSSRKLGREQKRRMREKGEEREERVPLFPSPSPFPCFFYSRSSFNSRNNSIENSGYVHPHKSPVAQWGRVWSSNQNSGGSREGLGGSPLPLFLYQTEARRAEKKNFKSGPPISQGLDDRVPPPPSPPYRNVWVRHCRRSWVRFLLKVTYFSET